MESEVATGTSYQSRSRIHSLRKTKLHITKTTSPKHTSNKSLHLQTVSPTSTPALKYITQSKAKNRISESTSTATGNSSLTSSESIGNMRSVCSSSQLYTRKPTSSTQDSRVAKRKFPFTSRNLPFSSLTKSSPSSRMISLFKKTSIELQRIKSI